MYNIYMNKNLILSKILRKNQTPQELKIWNLLRNRQFHNLKFKRQYPSGDYIVDFVCIEKFLIIEIDGGQHNEESNIQKDIQRSKYLESRGFKVIRFWNNDIDYNLDAIFEELENYI